jgi:OFA family oxalate/formate antiporter-like MFS transporter
MFYGWVVVAAAFAVTFVGFGSAYFVGSLQRDFAASRGSVSLVFSLAALLIDAAGWRKAYLILGALAVLLGGGMALLIENDPRDRGLNPDGGQVVPGTPAGSAQSSSVWEAVKTRHFVGLYAACLSCSFGLFVPFVHLVPYALDHGVARTPAVFLLGVIGIGSTAGRFFLGGLADRIGRQLALLCMFVGMALALTVWAFSTLLGGLVAFAFTFGVFYGGFVAILPALVMDYFGGRNVSGIIGALYTSVAFGTLIGPSAAGFAFDRNHNYMLPILGAIGANMIAAAIMVAMSNNARAASAGV